MLREYRHLKQEGGVGRRRLFESPDLDLIVWLDAADGIAGFQLCYAADGCEYAFTWRRDLGFAFNRVDAGDENALADLTPVLVSTERSPWPELAERWAARAEGIEIDLRNAVTAHLADARRAWLQPRYREPKPGAGDARTDES